MPKRTDNAISVVARATALIRAVARHEPAGATTTELAHEADLARPTAHRLLTELADEAFLVRDRVSGRWTLGPEMFLLGAVTASRYDIRSLAFPVVRRLADVTEESAFFSVVRGDEIVCLIREDGAFPIRSHVLYEGARFPLGVVSGGIVVLAFLPDEEVEELLGSHDFTGRYGEAHDRQSIRDRIAEAHRQGWSHNPGLIVAGSWGMAAAVFDPSDRPIGSLSLTGIEARFGPERRPELGATLLKAAHSLTRTLRERGPSADRMA